jgi:hypothetical protein
LRLGGWRVAATAAAAEEREDQGREPEQSALGSDAGRAVAVRVHAGLQALMKACTVDAGLRSVLKRR